MAEPPRPAYRRRDHERSPPLTRADDLPIHDPAKFRDLKDLAGEATAARVLGRLIEQLPPAFRDEAPEAVAREAHALISTAGMLGCDRLSETCRVLEEAAQAGADLRTLLDAARRTRDATLAALRALQAEEAALSPRKVP